MSNSYFTPDISEFTLPYGKHAGRLLSEVPRPYLHWAYNECDFKYFPEYQRAIEQYLGLTPDPNIRIGNRDSKIGNGAAGVPPRPAWGASGGPSSGLGGRRCWSSRTSRRYSSLLGDTLGKVRKALGI